MWPHENNIHRVHRPRWSSQQIGIHERRPRNRSWHHLLDWDSSSSLFSNVFLVQDTSLLLTYTPAGATVTGLTTVTTNFAASSTTYGNSDTLIITPPTGTPSSTTGARQGGAGQVGMDLGRIFSSAMVVLMLLTIFEHSTGSFNRSCLYLSLGGVHYKLLTQHPR